MKIPSPRVHDLLEIDGLSLVASLPSTPAPWLNDHLGRGSTYVIVRRPAVVQNQIPVGVRGAQRSQRFSAFIPQALVRRVLKPFQLLPSAGNLSSACFPALRSLVMLKARWAGLGFVWGPIGSVALELATGSPMVTAHSDLDVVLYAARRFTAGDAEAILATTPGLPVRVDIRVETPFCGFSLSEFSRAHLGDILLRTPEGPVLGGDPWNRRLGSMAGTAQPATGPS